MDLTLKAVILGLCGVFISAMFVVLGRLEEINALDFTIGCLIGGGFGGVTLFLIWFGFWLGKRVNPKFTKERSD